MDAPVAALQSPGVFSEDGRGSMKDNLDKRIDTILRRAHEATSLDNQSFGYCLNCLQLLIVWMHRLIQLFPENEWGLIES